MADICSFLKVIGANHEEVLNAIRMTEFKDFEDCLQYKCADSVFADYIVTRNTVDFSESDIQAVLPEDLMKLFKD